MWAVSLSNPNSLAVIFGCSGLSLTASERSFFAEVNPFGFILFQRNCETPDQVLALVQDLRQSIGREDAPVLIDQEGGRVARLNPPHWPEFPPAIKYAELYRKDHDLGLEAASLGGCLIAHELFNLGINVDCAPVLDVPQADADPIIGDRAFGGDVLTISVLAKAFADGLSLGGVDPVIKHIPGHGRALVDSHKALPTVDASLKELQDIDFPPFKALNTAPWAMTAHVIYQALDGKNPATTSAKIIADVVRKDFGFTGLLLSDDLSMNALSGTFSDRAQGCLDAGCDIALHCNGEREEMEKIACGAKIMTQAAQTRYKDNESKRLASHQNIDIGQARLRFGEILRT